MNVGLKTSGKNEHWEKLFKALPEDLEPGRVITAYKKRILIRTERDDVEGGLSGRFQHNAVSSEDFPVVGDWVAFSRQGHQVLIRKVLPRQSVLARKISGRTFSKQVLAANIDIAFIVQSLDRDFNMNRLERYMTVIYGGDIEPAVLLNKADLLDTNSARDFLLQVQNRFPGCPAFLTSATVCDGINNVKTFLKPGLTFCMIGSSGVGKSSLINALAGETLAETGDLSMSTSKGIHVTTRRELHILKDGTILIDTPGLREIGIGDAGSGLVKTFPIIYDMAESCRFDNCTHTSEPGCAVKEAVKKGILEKRQYENYIRLRDEYENYTRRITEKSRKKTPKNY
jgi:ribosome biogenesis GTPase / thiamine phosphate phosphatase